jgi:transposase
MSEAVVDGPGLGRGGRMSAGRERAAVLRPVRGEDLELVSRELGVTAARLSQWRDTFLAAGEAAFWPRARRR